MKLNELTALSPIDGRYRSKVADLAPFFSEFALIKYRVKTEVEYLIALEELGAIDMEGSIIAHKNELRKLYINFDEVEAQRIKETEKTTNHDVKAVEYYVKDALNKLGLQKWLEMVHFGLTSQDVNNTALPMLMKDYVTQSYIGETEKNLNIIKQFALAWENISLLARTHGQAASPTRLGKEMMVFVERIEKQLNQLKSYRFECKFGGATGNFNAHHVAYPKVDWKRFADQFCSDFLGLQRQQNTTQIEHYDQLAALFDNVKRINTIWIDFCRDVWTYISMEYFNQKIVKNEVGSSAMPHKVNPIDFENAEGNFGLANALFEHLAAKLPVSRLQRDLTDSTVSRNIGVPFAHTQIALASLEKGLGKLIVNEPQIKADLEKNVMVIAEAIQTILRREKFEGAYEALKALTRSHEKITLAKIHAWVDTLDISDAVKTEIKRVNPENYTGI